MKAAKCLGVGAGSPVGMLAEEADDTGSRVLSSEGLPSLGKLCDQRGRSTPWGREIPKRKRTSVLAGFDLIGIDSPGASDLEVIHTTSFWVSHTDPFQSATHQAAKYQAGRGSVLVMIARYRASLTFRRSHRGRRYRPDFYLTLVGLLIHIFLRVRCVRISPKTLRRVDIQISVADGCRCQMLP